MVGRYQRSHQTAVMTDPPEKYSYIIMLYLSPILLEKASSEMSNLSMSLISLCSAIVTSVYGTMKGYHIDDSSR